MNELNVAGQSRGNRTEIRGILAFPRIRDFYNALYDRLFMALEQFYLRDKFTFFLNTLPRNHREGTMLEISRFDPEYFTLTYAGIRQQRAFLEGDKSARRQKLDEAWNFLETALASPKETKISSKLYDEFRKGGKEGLSLEDIPEKAFGSIESYFSAELTEAQQCEYEILKAHDFLLHHYLSLPLIQFAEFDGVVHIIFSESDLARLRIPGKDSLNPEQIGNIIKAFSREYEGLILDWDIVDGNKYRKQTLGDAMTERMYSENLRNNPLLQQLKYQEYYRRHENYFKTRFDLAGEIPRTFRQQYHQIAILSILIDSYAHNISAHSLTALEWWFKQRAQLIKENHNGGDFQEDYPNLPVVRDTERKLEEEIHPLLRFLLDKGAFWTGLTRESNFGGKISSLHSVLWYDFINNPLYLGTIAYSEGILRVNVHITLLELKSNKEGIALKKKVILDGEFAHIDLSRFYDPEKDPQSKDYSHFVRQGPLYDEIEGYLKNYRVFFPGGVVGRHAFFTILENEIRNVKHFPQSIIDEMQEEGLTLNISIEEDSYETGGKTTYYKIGVWIKKPVNLSKKLLTGRLEKLYGEITEGEEHQPRLGGIFQDKVCAAMLFNNAFSSVQDEQIPTYKRYYPWVKVGSSYQLDYKTGDVFEDIEISARRYTREEFQRSRDFFDSHYRNGPGYYKKFFHLWKGENIYEAQPGKEKLGHPLENLSRFRFIYLPSEEKLSFIELRESGIFRIIHEKTNSIENAYRQWLSTWLKGAPSSYSAYLVIKPKRQGEKPSAQSKDNSPLELAAQLDFNGKDFSYYNKLQLSKGKGLEEPYDFQELILIHGEGQGKEQAGENFCRYRSHGILKKYFCDGQELHQAEMPQDLAAELLEVLTTRICIFDNRISNRLEKADKKIYKEQLLCEIYGENTEEWKIMKQKGFFDYHFLVVHLSFIEAFRNEKGEKKYDEKNIDTFIEAEILDGKKPPQNFILVITTGRGRTHWWSKLKDKDKDSIQEAKLNGKELPRLPYTAFVTFRPVESLIAAVENSLSIRDDIELKYRLVKILFGS